MESSIYSNGTGVYDDTLGESAISEKHAISRRAEELATRLEVVQQELHETRRGYQTALDIQRHLTVELETVQAESARVRADFETRLATARAELDAARAEAVAAVEMHATQLEALRAELRESKERERREREATPASPTTDRRSTTDADSPAEVDTGREEVRLELETVRGEAAAWRARADELAADMEQFRAAGERRAEELRAAAEREAAALAELSLARAAAASAADVDAASSHAVKGNSLFAEVEDKRQELARALLLSKQNNAQLRREVAVLRRDLDTLQRERRSAKDSAHQHFAALAEVYEERITQLEVALERARREPPARRDDASARRLPALTAALRERCSVLEREALSAGVAELAAARQLRDLRRRLVAPDTPHPAPADAAPPAPEQRLDD